MKVKYIPSDFPYSELWIGCSNLWTTIRFKSTNSLMLTDMDVSRSEGKLSVYLYIL